MSLGPALTGFDGQDGCSDWTTGLVGEVEVVLRELLGLWAVEFCRGCKSCFFLFADQRVSGRDQPFPWAVEEALSSRGAWCRLFDVISVCLQLLSRW